MAERLDRRQVVTFEELVCACLYEQEALRRVLVRKGLVTNEEGIGGPQDGAAGDGRGWGGTKRRERH